MTMTTKPYIPPGYQPKENNQGKQQTPQQRYATARVSSVAVIAVIVGLTFWLGISLTSLLPSIAIGVLLGAMKQIRPLRRLSDNPFFTAFLGAEWRRDRPTETVIDIGAALLVGFVVGLGVTWATTPAPGGDPAVWFAVVMGGAGGGGGAGAGFIEWILFLLFCALIGFVISLLTERVVLEAGIAAGEIAWPAAAAKATEYVVEESVTAAVNREPPPLVEPLIKGALHGALVGIALALLKQSG